MLSPPDWKQSELDTNSQSLQSLTKSFSVIHGFESFTEELKALHSFVRSPRSKKLRLRIIERYWKSSNHVQAVMSVQEALHKLHGDENYKTPEISLIHRFLAFEKLGRSDASICESVQLALNIDYCQVYPDWICLFFHRCVKSYYRSGSLLNFTSQS